MSIRSIVRTFLLENEVLIDTDGVDITDDFPLIDSGTLDSIGVLQLIRFLEKNFSIHVVLDDMAKTSFSSLLDIEKFVTEKLGHHA